MLVPVQPKLFAPVHVYAVVADGVTATELPVKAPGFQVYDVAPLPDKVAVPWNGGPHIMLLAVVAFTAGEGLTVTVLLVVFVQPQLAVPVTEYTVVAVGVIEIVDVFAPVFHV
jgi:hypothetical protein